VLKSYHGYNFDIDFYNVLDGIKYKQ